MNTPDPLVCEITFHPYRSCECWPGRDKASDYCYYVKELTLFITSGGKVVGYSIGNDMSSRSIEGENPLYLPQAKTYDGCAALGPCILVTGGSLSPETLIGLKIQRSGRTMFEESVALSRMKRTPEELAGYLYRESSFPFGCFLMTGTGIVPGADFTLQSDDIIEISIDTIGILRNIVA